MIDNQIRDFMNDEELLAANFRIVDPLKNVENLVKTKPDASLNPAISGFYDETPHGGKNSNPDFPFIWCCHCQKETHWKGYVLEDGGLHCYTIGNNCGHDHYGASFESVVRNFNERRARQGVLRSFGRLVANSKGLEGDIERLLACPSLRMHESTSQEFFRAAPRAFAMLKGAAEKGSLSGVVRTRNYNAEKEREERFDRALSHYQSLPSDERRRLRDEGLKPELDDTPIIDSRSVDFGAVFGYSLLGLNDVRQRALFVKDALSRFRIIERAGTNGTASKIISNTRRELFDAIADLRGAVITTSMCETFFGRDNLERICQWSECYRGFSCWIDEGSLVVRDDNKQPFRVQPFSIDIVATPVLERLRYTGIEDDLLKSGDAVMEDPSDPASPVYV